MGQILPLYNLPNNSKGTTYRVIKLIPLDVELNFDSILIRKYYLVVIKNYANLLFKRKNLIKNNCFQPMTLLNSIILEPHDIFREYKVLTCY